MLAALDRETDTALAGQLQATLRTLLAAGAPLGAPHWLTLCMQVALAVKPQPQSAAQGPGRGRPDDLPDLGMCTVLLGLFLWCLSADFPRLAAADATADRLQQSDMDWPCCTPAEAGIRAGLGWQLRSVSRAQTTVTRSQLRHQRPLWLHLLGLTPSLRMGSCSRTPGCAHGCLRPPACWSCQPWSGTTPATLTLLQLTRYFLASCSNCSHQPESLACILSRLTWGISALSSRCLAA